MPSDEYASFGGGGALKLKGAKVKKHKKKKDKVSDLERALSTGETSSSPRAGGSAKPETEEPGREGEDGKEVVRSRDGSSHGEGGKEEEDEDQRDSAVSYKTEAERRFEEAKRKKVSTHSRDFTEGIQFQCTSSCVTTY